MLQKTSNNNSDQPATLPRFLSSDLAGSKALPLHNLDCYSWTPVYLLLLDLRDCLCCACNERHPRPSLKYQLGAYLAQLTFDPNCAMTRLRSSTMALAFAFFLSILCHASARVYVLDGSSATLHNSTFDYVVVGCGIAGLVVSNRLSEDSTSTVLCVEAGAL